MPEWHLVGDLTDPNVNPNDLPAEVAARLAGDAAEASDRIAADTAGAAEAATEVTTRSDADTVLAGAIAAEAASRVAASGYTHLQATPASVWLVTHNLGYDPGGVTVYSEGFQMDEFGIHYVSPGQTLILTFDIALAGAANLS
jgi:hypothetical protein